MRFSSSRGNHRIELLGMGLIVSVLLLSIAWEALAATPVTLFQSEAGYMNFTGTGGTLRLDSNQGDACSTVNSGRARLAGIPSGALVVSATLYWAGSWSPESGSTQTTPDWNVSFEGQPIAAQRRYDDTYAGSTAYDFFSGAADVTTIVAAKGNGNYEFADLSVNEGSPHCDVQAVLAGWSLVVIYSHPSEPLRVINHFEGFQAYRGGRIRQTPNNFRIPEQNINGSCAFITWEGDEENSHPLQGTRESVRFNGRPMGTRLNPRRNPFNSTVSWLNEDRSWGVDFDSYDISRYLRAGDESARTTYSSGADLVLLSAEIIAVTNTPVANLAIDKSHGGSFPVGGQGEFSIVVSNDGPSDCDAPVQVRDILPAGLSYAGGSFPGWTVDTSNSPEIIWTWNGPLPSSSTLPPISLLVDVSGSAGGTITNTAEVECVTFDHDLGDNRDSDSVLISAPGADIVLVKAVQTLSDPVNGSLAPKAVPGALVRYDLSASNLGPSAVDTDGLQLADTLPATVDLFVGDIASPGGGPFLFLDGAAASGLIYSYGGLGDMDDDLEFSSDGLNFNYVPTPDGQGFDAAVRHFRFRPGGTFNGGSSTDSPKPSFTLRFQARLR